MEHNVPTHIHTTGVVVVSKGGDHRRCFLRSGQTDPDTATASDPGTPTVPDPLGPISDHPPAVNTLALGLTVDDNNEEGPVDGLGRGGGHHISWNLDRQQPTAIGGSSLGGQYRATIRHRLGHSHANQ